MSESHPLESPAPSDKLVLDRMEQDNRTAKKAATGSAVAIFLAIFGLLGTFPGLVSYLDGRVPRWAPALIIAVGMAAMFGTIVLILRLRIRLREISPAKLWARLAAALVIALVGVVLAGGTFSAISIWKTMSYRTPRTAAQGGPTQRRSGPPHSGRPSPTRSLPSDTGNPFTLAVPGNPRITSVTFSSDGKFLAAGDAGGTVHEWTMSSRTLVASMTDPGSRGVNSVAFNVGNTRLAAADGNGHVYLWAGNDLTQTLADPSGSSVRSVAFSRDGKFLGVGDAGGNVYVWQLGGGDYSLSGPPMTDPASDGVNSVAFNPANTLLAAGDANGHIYLWVHTLGLTLTDPSGASIRSVTFTPSNQLVAGDGSGKVYEWGVTSDGVNVGTSGVIASLTDPNRNVDSVAVNPSTYVIAAGDANGNIDLGVHTFTDVLADPKSRGVRSVAFSPDGAYLAVGDANAHIYLWHLSS